MSGASKEMQVLSRNLQQRGSHRPHTALLGEGDFFFLENEVTDVKLNIYIFKKATRQLKHCLTSSSVTNVLLHSNHSCFKCSCSDLKTCIRYILLDRSKVTGKVQACWQIYRQMDRQKDRPKTGHFSCFQNSIPCTKCPVLKHFC